MKEEVMYVVDTLGVTHEEVYQKTTATIPDLFVEGGLGGMIIITLLLIALLLAAWKAPRWVKEIGIGALVVSIFWAAHGLYQAAGVVQMVGDISPGVLFGGIKVMLIPLLYGLMIYFISLIIRIIQKPRI